LDVELVVNDEELEQAFGHLHDELAIEQKQVEWAYGKISYEKSLYTNYLSHLNKLSRNDIYFDNNLQILLQVKILHLHFHNKLMQSLIQGLIM
jgi:hypothetical protein